VLTKLLWRRGEQPERQRRGGGGRTGKGECDERPQQKKEQGRLEVACIVLVRAAPRTFSCSESDAFIVSSGTVSRIDRTNAAALGAAFSALRSASEGVSDIDPARNPKFFTLNCT
jgi:hypothetical protein